MIYTPLTNQAMLIAYNAHHGQLDYNGVPYIYHPIHITEQMDDEYSCCVALLHDVVEDTDVTLDELKAIFPSQVTEAVALMTHSQGIDYFDYVRSIKANPIARKVKLADLSHNSDQSRCVGSDLTEEQKEQWRGKYEKATKILTGI